MSHHWSVRALSHPTPDTDVSLLVSFDNARYLINCGEGTQRAFVQGKMSLRKLKGVLVTGSGQDVVGGLPGILMSAADAGVKDTIVAGPEGLYQYLASCRTFVQRDSLCVDLPHPAPDTHEIHKTPSISIKAIPIAASSSSSQAESLETRPEQGAFHWKDRKVRLNQLTDVQLRWWRRVVIADMFGGWRRYADAAAASVSALDGSSLGSGVARLNSENSQPELEGHRSSPARFHMPQVIPRRGTDSLDPAAKSACPHADDRSRMAYVLQAPPVRGKFNADKAKALGVPNGPLRGRLTKGEAIEVEDAKAEGGKRTIRPEDVLGETVPGAVCIVVDVASEHISSLVANEAFRPYMQDPAGDSAVSVEHHTHLVVHRAAAEVLADERYQRWMASFGAQAHHLIADPTAPSGDVSFSSAGWNLLRMSQLDPAIFAPPVSGGDESAGPVDSAVSSETSLRTLGKGLSVRMHPPAAPEQLPQQPNNPVFPPSVAAQRAALEDLAIKNTRYLSLTSEAQQRVEKLAPATGSSGGSQPNDYGISVVPLGTGSAIPSKYRNVSSTLIHVPGFGHMLLDAGEGTLGQLRRRFGKDLVTEVYQSLRFIFISHMHADHHLGLQRVLADWQSHCPNQTLYLVGPSYIWLHLVESGLRLDAESGNIRYMDCFHLMRPRQSSGSVPVTEYQEPGPSRQERTLALANQCMSALEFTELHAPVVTHRGRAHGLVVAHNSGWKIAYSGDTTPCQALVEAGQDATLLIHEATLEDDKPEMALAKGHSTFGQAIDVGVRMRAHYLLLNHFSQRYPKLPRLSSTADGSSDTVTKQPIIALAFDLMTLPLSSFWKMAHYTEALAELFSEVEAAESDAGSEASGADTGKQGKKQQQGKKGEKGSQKRKLAQGTEGQGSRRGAGRDALGASPLAKRSRSGEGEVVMQEA